MRVVFAIVIAAGCTSSKVHTSVLAPYVRDLRVGPAGLDMIQCETVFKETKTTTWILWDRNDDVSRSLSPGQCWRQTIPVAVTEVPR